MFKKKIGRVASLAAAVGLACMCIVPVSAAYVDMLDYGLAYGNPRYNQLNYGLGAGEQFYTYGYLAPFWALDSYQSDYTYTFTFSFTSASSLATTNANNNKTFISNTKLDTLPASGNDKAYQSITKSDLDTGGYRYDIVVKFNPGLIGLDYFPIWVYAGMFTGAVTITTNSWGASASYDPGGSQYIQDLVDEVATIRQNDETYHSNALEVLDGIKSGIDGMPGEIKDVLEQHDQDVKQEASTEGNDNINQATSALTNALPVASISDAIAPLVTACGYNGITSVWSFPAMKIPAIAGLFDEIQLNEVQNFDLCSYAEQYIPDELLTLIRSITTVLLIVWAIREIMSLLSGMLGGGDSVGSG